jgi:hypothetical protein
VTAGARVAFADEMRLGLHGQVRRVWAPRGVKVRQRVQLRYQWRWLALAVDPLAGRLQWRWLPNLRKEAVADAAGAWKADGVAALVWDGAPSHRAKTVREAGPTLVALPPAAPALNPPERVFQELRRTVEGLVYATLEEKVAAVERALAALAADPARLRRLIGWGWIADNLARLPAPNPAPS